MATKPSVYPDWAVKVDGTDNDVVDGTTGQNNVVAPSAPKQLLGWEYNEKPPRQYFNWLARLVTQWIRWLDGEMTLRDNTYAARVTATYFTAQADFNLRYSVHGKFTMLSIPLIRGTSAAGASGKEFQIEPTTATWPGALVPKLGLGAGSERHFPVMIELNNDWYPGALIMPISGTAAAWIVKTIDPTLLNEKADGWVSGQSKALMSGGIVFENNL